MEFEISTETYGNMTATDASADTRLTRSDSASVPAWVYFIKSGDYIKIGYATSVEKRMADLQTGSPHVLELLGKMPATSIKDEFQVHLLFRHLYVRGEWFHDNWEIRAFAKRKTPRVKKPPRKRKLVPPGQTAAATA